MPSQYEDHPTRYIDRQEGVRHVLHAAIRMTLKGEDPFAVHLLVQSAEKVCIDLVKHSGQPDPFFALIYTKKKKEFLGRYREPYNFMKHADRDHGNQLRVYDIVSVNDKVILACAIRYGLLFGSRTKHMALFLIFAGLLYPGTLNWDGVPWLRTSLKSSGEFRTRGELAADLCITLDTDAEILLERQQDLSDVAMANQTKIPPMASPDQYGVPVVKTTTPL